MTDNGLFRREAVHAQSDSRFGDAVFHQPPSLKVLVSGLFVIFTLFVCFAALAEIKQTEQVRGYLLAAEGEVRLYPPRTAVLQRLEVDNGTKVAAGDVLAVFSDPVADERGIPVASQMLDYLDHQIVLTEDRVSLLIKRADIRNQQYVSRIANAERELEVLREEFELVSNRIRIGKKEFESNEILYHRDLISEREYFQSASAWYSLQQLGKTTEQGLLSRKQTLNDLRQQHELQAVELQEELLTLDLNLTQLRAQRSERQSQAQQAMVASVAGRIHNLIHQEGDSVDPRSPFLTLIPENHYLEARLYLPSRAVAKVREGQQILLTYDAFPYQTFGSFSASVESISRTTIDPREFLFPVDIREPVYLLRAVLNPSGLSDADIDLRPGMQFSADIITGQQSLLRRLVSPLNPLSRRL